MKQAEKQRKKEVRELVARLLKMHNLSLSETMFERIQAAQREVIANNFGNQNSAAVDAMLLQMQQKMADTWVQELVQVYKQVWKVSGQEITPELLRSLGTPLTTLLKARESAVVSQLRDRHHRSGRNESELKPTIDEFRRCMKRLANKWLQKIEAEALECELRSKPARAAVALRPSSTSRQDSNRYKRDPDVARRRTIIQNNPGKSARQICRILDLESVPVKWEAYIRWADAYDNEKYRGRIDKLISNDRSYHSK